MFSLEDFDYCEKCEATVEHPHPFLKIKDPKHHPRAVITILEEDFPAQNSNASSLRQAISDRLSFFSKETKEQVTKAVNGLNERIFGAREEVIEKVEVEEPERIIEEKIVPVIEPVQEINFIKEPVREVVVEEVLPICVSFVKEICTIPSRITVNDKAIYKTVSLRNSGRVEWPSNCFVRNIAGIRGQDTKLLALAPGKEISCILILESPPKGGDYLSAWRLAYHDEKNSLQFTGETFDVQFTVVEPEAPLSDIKLVESQVLIKEIKKPEPEPKVEEKKPEKPSKTYRKDVHDKVNKLREVLPEVNMEEMLEFVAKNPNVTLEELFENCLA